MRKTERVSIWPVGFILGLTYEGPICRNNSIVIWRQWKSHFSPYREFPIDMAGFAVHLSQFFEHPKALFDSSVGLGQLETEFILQFISHREEAECRGSEKEVGRYIDVTNNIIHIYMYICLWVCNYVCVHTHVCMCT